MQEAAALSRIRHPEVCVSHNFRVTRCPRASHRQEEVKRLARPTFVRGFGQLRLLLHGSH